MTRRPAHGGTRRPPLSRPGNGFGRSVRPRPSAQWRDVKKLAPMCSWDPSELLGALPTTTTPISVTIDDATVTA